MNDFRGLLSLVLMVRLFAVQASGSEVPPNILYIFSDDQSYRTVSCYPRAYNFANTPNIDRLADQGVRFDQAYIGAKCVPSRATMLTGRLQFAIESNYDGSDIPGNTYWFPTLRNKGYYMGMIGKWHYGQGAAAHQHGISWDWSVVWDHGAYDAAGGYYYDQKVMINGAPQVDLGGYSTDRYTDYTEQFIRERAEEPEKPWFYWLAYAGVHGPYTPAARHIGMLDDEPTTAIPADVWGPRPGKPSHFQDSKWTEGANGMPIWKGDTLDYWVKQQTEAVASIDDSVGRIMTVLEETGQLENTIVIFTSDQGYVWGHHGLKGKIDPYETAIRSPFIVSNPARFPVGKVCKAPINGPDVIRTFHAWADAEPALFMPGRDITALIENPDSEPVLEEWAEVPTMMTYVKNRYEPMEMAVRLENEDWDACMYDTDTPWYFMIVVENYKYTRYANPDRIEELYDLDLDPEELDNLAIKAQFKSKLLEMRAACIQSIKDNGGSVFADFLPPPTTEGLWPAVYPSDNAYVLYGSNAAQRDGEVLKAKGGWGSSDSQMAYLRFDLSGDNEIDNHPADSILTVSLDLWMTQVEGDVENDLQVFALVDGAQDSPASLSENEWTSSTGASPLRGTNLPQGNHDPEGSSLTTVMLGSHTFAATGDDTELGLLQIPLTVSDFKTLLQSDGNGEITLIVRSTSGDLSADFASVSHTNSEWAAPALTVTALPAPPTGLAAAAGDGLVMLDWDDHPGPNLNSYNVYRSTTPGNYGSTPAADVASSSYVDSLAENGTTYYYTVTAVDIDTNETAKSSEVSVTPEEFTPPSGVILFGTNHEGLAGFTQSTLGASESWTIEGDSVQYRSQDSGTQNGSLLREFPLDRSVGSSYVIEGTVQLTDGYAEDNNRVGIYLFGDQADLGVAPGEDESGALCLLFNTEFGTVRLFEGIDMTLQTEAQTGRVRDDGIFGNEVKFTAEISFIEDASDSTERIQIIGRFTDELGAVTEVNGSVAAADYTGDWFGFATRARSRDYGSGGAKSAPFVMDYKSFRVSGTGEPLSDYEQWAEDNGIGSDALETDDFDNDGASNLYEYGVGGNPDDDQDQGTKPTLAWVDDAMVYVYPKRSDTDDLIYTVETTTSLTDGDWSATRYTVGETNVTGETLDFVPIYLDTSGTRMFVRLKIER